MFDDSTTRDRYNDIAASANLISGEEFRDIVYSISKYAADMVVKTLGPFGSTTIIDDSTFTYPSKDGWSCLNRLHFNDPIYDSIYKCIRQISFTIVNKVGDGTTSALIGANAFLEEILDYQDTNEFRQTDFMNALSTIRDKVINKLLTGDELHLINKEGDFSDIKRVAYVSSNSNETLSNIIQKIYQETNNPNVYVTLDSGNKLDYEIQNGYRFECATLNHKVYINSEDRTCVLNHGEALIAIFNHNLNYNEHGQLVTMLSNYANSKNKTVIIAAPYFDDILTNYMGTIINSMIQKHQVPNIILMQIPLTMDIQHYYMSDLNMFVNGQIIDSGKVRAIYAMIHNQENPDDQVEAELLKTPTYNFESPEDLFDHCLGHINKIVISDTYAVLQDYNSIYNENLYKQTLAEAKEKYDTAKEKANKSDTNLSKEFMDANQRYVKLIGKMGIIKVGGVSELEKHCIKDSVDDSVLACRSAYENGYIRGLNLATLKVIRMLMKDKNNSVLESNVLEMLNNVFLSMTNAVMTNKYSNDAKRLVTLPAKDKNKPPLRLNFTNEEIVEYCIDNNLGYNLVTETFDFMDDLTVINSVSTDVEILKAILGILSLMLTSSQFLSTNRAYDRKMTRAQAVEQKTEDTQKMVSAVADTIISKLNGNPSLFQKIASTFKR